MTLAIAYALGAVAWAATVAWIRYQDRELAVQHSFATWVVAAVLTALVWPIMVCWVLGEAALYVLRDRS